MKIHIPSLPHTAISLDYAACAYTQKVVRLKPMMAKVGVDIVTYGLGGDVETITAEEQAKHGFNGPHDYNHMNWDADKGIWPEYNLRTIEAIKANAASDDIIGIIAGAAQESVVNAFPELISVEWGIGYYGVLERTHHVFESYAWMHHVLGTQRKFGRYFDTVIHNSYEVDKFPFVEEPDDYYFFAGRLDAAKGLLVAQQACEKLGKRLVIAGIGPRRGYGEFVGMVGRDEVAKLMGHAKALFIPTEYVGPFEGVHAEAMLTGTPVITTDWGIFTETVENGFNGYRCSMFRDFLHATEAVVDLDRKAISEDARKKFSTETAAKKYKDYFERVHTLYSDGWYAE